MMYCSCKYAPVELMAGFGEGVQRLDPSPPAFSCAESCTHPNMCSFAKAVIEEVYQKDIRQLILTDCCDAVRRMYDALMESRKMDFLYLLPLPHKRGPAEIRLLSENLRKLAREYEHFSQKKFDAEKAADAFRKQLAETAADACREQLTETAGCPEGTVSGTTPQTDYIRLMGAHSGRKLLQLTQEIFPDTVVVDETCSGNRRFCRAAGKPDDFFDWYADALLSQENPCMRMWRPVPSVPEGDAGRPAGSVFHTIKFCDYYGFEYMMMQKDAFGKIIRIETDTTGSASGQLLTRLEAFREELDMNKKSAARGEISADKSSGKAVKLFVAGIDSGSTSTDAVIMDAHRNILSRVVLPTAAGAQNSSGKALGQALKQAGLRWEDLSAVVSTGYGRGSIQASDRAVTEITCHAKGAHFLNPDVRTVIDIGGQDSKVIRIDSDGKVQNFVMNDKCAAGTGRFLEMQAKTLGLGMAEMSAAGLTWKKDLTITSMCTVFAESEVVSLVADNMPPSDIIHGLNKAIAKRTAAMVSRLRGTPPFIMTGGVAQNAGVVRCLEEELHQPIFVSEDAQICGAIGACLAALEQAGS